MKKTSNSLPFFSICCQSYISEAVSRFFRTEPTNISKNDSDSNQESDNLTAISTWPTEDDGGIREVKEEPLASVSELASPRPGVAWDTEVAHIQYETQQGGDDLPQTRDESRVSQEAQGNGKDEFAQTADEDAGLVRAEDAKEDKQDEDQILCTYGRDEALEDDEFVETLNSRLTGDAMSEGGGKVGAEESEEAIKQDEVQKKDEKVQEVNDAEEKDNGEVEDKVGLMAEDSEVNLCMTAALSIDELNANMKEKMMQKLEEVTPPTEEEVNESDVVLLLDSNEGNKAKEGARQDGIHLLSHEKLPDEDQDFKESQSLTLVHAAYDRRNSMSDDAEGEAVERKQEVVTEEENVNELEEDINLAPEECQEISVDTCSEKSVPSAETDLQTVECTDGESVAVSIYPEVQTERKYDVKTDGSVEAVDEKSDLPTTDVDIDDGCLESDQTEEEDEVEEVKMEEEEDEEEDLSSEVSNNEEYPIEATCTSTSVTVDSESETVQETSGEFKNIPPGVCEGQLVVPRESPLCEEARGGVPEHNNETGGDENTTQRFLEEQDSKEVQSMELPEEVESLHNTGRSHGADYFLVKELIEEEEERTDDIKCSFDSVVEEHAGKLCLTEGEWLQDGKASFVEQAIQDLSADSMKTGDTHSEQEFKVFVGSSHLTEEQQDETGELLVEFETDGCVLKEAGDATDDDSAGAAEAREVVEFTDEFLNTLEAEVQKMTELSFDVEPENAVNLEQSGCRIPSLRELSESGCVERSVESEPRLFEDSGLDFQGAEINVEKTEFTVEEDAEEDDVQNRSEEEISEKHVDRIATAEWEEKAETVIAESEIVEIQNQLSDEALEISIEESEVEPKTKDVSMISAEETDVHVTESGEIKVPAGEPQDVIDEEILDLWIQTTEEDTDDIIDQEAPEPGKQMDGEMEPWNEEPGAISSVLTEKKEEPLVELNSGDPDSVNDTEVSSATAEIRLWDPEMMTSTTEELIHDVYDMLVDTPESEDLSALSLQQSNSESQDILSEKGQSYLEEMELVTETELDPGSGFNSPMTRHSSEELEETQENTGEEGVSEIIETDVEVMDLTEDADFHLLTNTLTSFKVEDPMVEDELLPDSQDELKQAEQEQYKSGSEASSEEDDVEDSGSPQPGWPEDTDLFPGLNRTEVEEELTPEFGDLMEVMFYIYPLKQLRLKIIHNLER